MITVEELKAKFPVRDVAPYGSCIVVPGAEFDPDWEVFLGDQGYKCFFIDLDRKPVTLVKLPKDVGKSAGEKEVYRPPSQVLPKHWSPEEDEVLIKLWNDNVLIEKMTPSFPHRTEAAIRLRIQRLEKYGKIKKRTGRPKAPLPTSSVKRWSKDEEQLLVEFWNKDLKVPDMLAHFPGRTRHSIAMHIDVLQKAGKISPRWKAGEAKRKPEKIARAGSEPAPPVTPVTDTSKPPYPLRIIVEPMAKCYVNLADLDPSIKRHEKDYYRLPIVICISKNEKEFPVIRIEGFLTTSLEARA